MAVSQQIFNFKNGVIDPIWASRYDAESYAASCETLENFVINKAGGAEKRQGLKYIDTLPSGDIEPIKFFYSNTDYYLLIFSNNAMRVVKDGEVLQSGGSDYTLTTGITSTQVSEFDYVQINDIVIITHSDFTPKILTRLGDTNWTIADFDLTYKGPFLDWEDQTVQLVIGRIGDQYDLGTYDAEALFTEDDVGKSYKIKYTFDDYLTVTSGTSFPDYIEGIYALPGESFDISITDATGEGFSCIITIQKSKNAGISWTNDTMVNAVGVFKITNDTNEAAYYRVGVFTDEDHVEGEVNINVSKECVTVVEVTDYVYNYYVLIDLLIPLSGTFTWPSPVWTKTAWTDTLGYPSACCFHDQRLILANTAYQPNRFWGSEINNFINFDTGGINADDPFSFELASDEEDSIQWMKSGRVLMVGTSCNEWRISGSTGSMGPTSIDARRLNHYSSSSLRPAIAGSTLLYAQNRPSGVRQVYYDYTIDGYKSLSITDKANHLVLGENTWTFNQIVSMDFANGLESVLYLVMDDGNVISINYNEGYGINAASLITTDGDIKKVCVSPMTDFLDTPYFVVERTINGSTVNTLEMLTPQHWFENTSMFYMDCYIEQSLSPATTITGLSVLEGEEVNVIVEGHLMGNQTVSGGAITLGSEVLNYYNADTGLAKVVVGLPYTATLKTNRLMPTVTSLGKRQLIRKIHFNMYKTTECQVKVNDGAYTYVNGNSPTVYDSGISFFSDIVTVPLRGTFDNQSYVTIYSDQPIPVTVLGMSLECEVNKSM